MKPGYKHYVSSPSRRAEVCSRPLDRDHERRRPRTIRAFVGAALAIGACASPAPNGESLPRNSVDMPGQPAAAILDAGALVSAVNAPDISDASVDSQPPRGPKNPLGFWYGERLTPREDADGDASTSEAKFQRQVLAAKQHNRWAGVMRSLKSGANPNVSILDEWPLITVIASYDAETQISVMGKPATRESPRQVAYRFQILRFLLNNGVSIEQPGSVGQTPLMVASGTAQLHLVRFLLRKGARTGSADEEGRNAIFYPKGALRHAKLKIVKLLIAAGADVNHRAKQGFTPLMDAAIRGDRRMARRLLLVGADLSLVDEQGRTAADIATQRGHTALAKDLGAAMR